MVRVHEAPQRADRNRVLSGNRNRLQADGYSGCDDYEGVAIREHSPILIGECWAHARGQFHNALRSKQVAAQIALSRISQLHAREKTLCERAAREWRELDIKPALRW